ncbi:MAG: hypothetical protein IPP10_12915 [Candidatus Competibacteraceae bacterium]|jgi:hypothetical protein|nr:hypothetical protein [Candidatus Competibacteraceae bacterium]MBK7984842.1 hypothetical protein [Candidatus Competibacteraceae bacterium]MBK8899394.1 hypothetical protein [Candidatus Competibacteraceae bacterium]MBK8964399.1 hypothetical protein [Candidatus Competibacteraceae bacterium]MBK9952387.1 hypothetical protein [Candidatus Competibacteraceae bacterium]
MYAEIMLGTRPTGRGHPVADYRAADFLRQEIAFFEARLHEMGEEGDCAYEHALSRAYETLLRERRDQLSQLRA